MQSGMRETFGLLAGIAFLLLTAGGTAAGPFLDVEGGVAVSGYNDVRIPGDTGTEFSLTDDLSTDPAPFGRLRIGTIIGDRHHVSGFVAPLRLSAEGTIDESISFAGTEFESGRRLDATYRFDSYRLTYRYRVYLSESIGAWLGLTAKIRDAEIAIESGETKASKKNTGFVPLLAFRIDWQVASSMSVVLEGDALAGGPGRAEDVFLGLAVPVGSRIQVKGGYRILEGGADVEEVYNFALIHFAALGCVVRL